MSLRSQTAAGALAAGAAVVLILSMFLDWYKLDVPSQVRGRPINVPSYDAFELLERSDVYLVIAAVVGLICAGLLIARLLADSPVPALVLGLAALFALATVIYRGTSRPKVIVFGLQVDTTLKAGWFIAVLAAGVMLLGALLAYLAGPQLRFQGDGRERQPETGEEA